MALAQNSPLLMALAQKKILQRKKWFLIRYESVLAPLFFSIYKYYLPTTTAKKSVYTCDLTIMHSTTDRKAVQRKLYPEA